MSIYKLDCEYALEEAKNVDANDITTHPFFKKHFATSNSRPGPFSSTLYVKPDKEQDHVIHYITHTPLDPHHESNIDHSKHAVKIETQHYGRTKHIGHGRGMTVHEAMDNAVHTYTHPLKIKPLTESLVGKKPATASKLFAEAMEARLDELSKKTLGNYIKKAVRDKERNVRNATKSLERAQDLMRKGRDAESSNEFNTNYVQDNTKSRKRSEGISKAVDRLTKEDLDEVEAPATFWNAGMARMNPIQVSQKQPAEPGQFKATLTKSPRRLADQDSSLEGKPRAVRDETCETATSRGPKTIELTGDWHADVPDHQFDPKLDSETEYYPLFSQFKSLGAYPSGPARAWESEEIDEDELNEISKKTLGRYIERAANSKMMAGVRSQEAPIDSEEEKKQLNKIRKRSHGISRAVKKLTEDSVSLMATATKDEKKAAEQDKKKPAEFKKLHDKHEAEVKSKMKELGEEALDEISDKLPPLKKFKVYTPKYDTHAVVSAKNKKEAHTIAMSKYGSAYERQDVKITRVPDETLEEGLFDPAKQPLLALWDEHARRSDAHGSGSRTEILKRIEDHVAKKHGQEGLKKMRLHSDLSNALKKSMSGDKGHLQALLGNMRAKCAMEQ